MLLWSDNSTTGDGPDKLVFRFSGFGGSDGTTVSSNRLSSTDLDALHVAQFTGTGLMGLGNTFGTNATGMTAANYIEPQSLQHMSYDWRSGAQYQPYGFSQITYRRDGVNTPGTGETANDGLRWGIDNTLLNVDGISHLNAYLRWQENTPFIIQTDWDNTPGGINSGERLRISSIGAPGVTAPAGAPNNNITRVAISHAGNQPITNPRSLLHLGYNTSTALIGGGQLDDGWRSWMDVGIFTAQDSDNMYVGLKREGDDRQDAVINWGDNQVAGISPNGPDKLRFIFTASTTTPPPGQGDPVSQSQDGLETMRIVPIRDTLGTYGRVGVGDFTVQGVNEEPTHKIDVVGNGRFRYLPDSIYMADSTVDKYVMVDSMGVLRWADMSSSQNGYVDCADTTSNGSLLSNSKLNLNNNNLYFEHSDVIGQNHIGIGYNCDDVLPAKISVLQEHPNTVNVNTTAVSGINTDVTNDMLKTYSGVYGEASGVHPPNLRSTNIGGNYTASGADMNWALRANIENNPFPLSQNVGLQIDIEDDNSIVNYGIHGNIRGAVNSSSIGIHLTASGSYTNTPGLSVQAMGGVFSGHGAENRNVGVLGYTGAHSPFIIDNPISSTEERFGVAGIAAGANANYAIYGQTDTSFPNSYAGYFAGPVVMNQASIWSDENLKQNITPISETDSILNLLNPVEFEYITSGDGHRLNLQSGKKLGLIAQEVEQIFPEFVSTARHPAELDSTGNILQPALFYKVLDLEQFIPFLIRDAQSKSQQIKDLNELVDTKDSLLNNLNDRLTNLENCLSNILPALCQVNNSMIQENSLNSQEILQTILNVELFDGENIVLNQNVPNPFAESTVITYSIPESVQKAQLHFYNMSGQLIKTVDITSRGAGRMNVFGSDLSTGTYTYTLIADGQVVDTKRMVKSN